eukprot:TRINITY_DN7363_c0_g2_i1.p1 TRINITY_DN7363_c0_g2~~TRINITY_DN7363_c0_g2_i1.p1  ORF type:complete len:294 (+),score=53.38 TRINITY_DN7363_c0_g2_i1:51-884(+)
MMKSLIISLCLLVSVSGVIVPEDDGKVTYYATAEDPCVIATPEGTINIGSLEVTQFTMNIDVFHESVFYWMVGWCQKQVSSPPVVNGQPMQACDSSDIPSYVTQHTQSSFCDFSMHQWLSGITAEKLSGIWVVSYKALVPASWVSEKQTHVNIECAPSVAEVECDKISQFGNCLVYFTNGVGGAQIYTSTFQSRFACPSGGGGGGGGGCGFSCAFLLIFFLGGFVYLVSFMAYNYKFKELRGRELLPHQEFWKSIPGLCKDGAIFLFMKIKGCFARS